MDWLGQVVTRLAGTCRTTGLIGMDNYSVLDLIDSYAVHSWMYSTNAELEVLFFFYIIISDRI